MRLMPVLLVDVPDVPVIVTSTVPTGAVALAVRVNVLFVVAGFGTNEAVTPLGRPDAAKVALPGNPFAGFTVIVLAPSLPCTTPRLLGEDESAKYGRDPPQLLRIHASQTAEMASSPSFSRSM